MKVIFLDFNGVLDSRAWDDRRLDPNLPSEARPVTEFDPELVARVQRVCDATDARIVVSSDWRRQADLERLRSILLRNGLRAWVIGVTPVNRIHFHLDVCREAEIREWIAAHPEVHAWIAIDDLTLALGDRLVNTVEETGITDADVEAAIEKLTIRCRTCSAKVEPQRECYAVPTCYACLPPPPPLPIAHLPSAAPRDELVITEYGATGDVLPPPRVAMHTTIDGKGEVARLRSKR